MHILNNTRVTYREADRQGEARIQTELAMPIDRIPIVFRSVEGAIAFSPATLHFDFPPSASDTLLPTSIFATSSCR